MNEMRSKSGKVALVTGAARGLGKAFAIRLAQEGASVAAIDKLDMDGLAEELMASGAGDAMTVGADLTNEAEVAAMGARVLDRFGKCDIVVNNAGFCAFRPFAGMPLSAWRETMAINLDSMFLVCQLFVPGMTEKGYGRIVNLTSSMLNETVVGFTHYLASKGAIVGFTRALANEVGAQGITVNCIAPALTATPRTLEELPDSGIFDMIAKHRAIKRAATPEDYVGAMSFLASEDAAFMTGQTLIIDGGLLKSI